MSARFVFRPLSAEQMARVGERVIAEVVRARIAKGINVNDGPAKPLSKTGQRRNRYFYIKRAKGLPTIRDLVYTGRTMAALGVVSARSNQVRLGFNNPRAAAIAYFNQRRDPMFWFSPEDQRKIGLIVSEEIAKGGKLVTVVESSTGERFVFSRSAA
jgi:hypothetical protein